MSATGKTVPFGGVATTTETRVVIPSAYKRGFPNPNPSGGAQTYPTPAKRSAFLKNIRINNLDATNNLLIRINGAAQQITLKPNSVPFLMDPAEIHDLTVQASAATVAWDGAGVVTA